MTLLELRNLADTKLAQFWDVLIVKQEQYLKNKGRYWQGVLTPTNTPTDGIEASFDTAKKPSYQTEDWKYLELPVDTKIPFQIAVDQYVCPDENKGFQATIFVNYNNKIYSRSKGLGKEAKDRDYNWTEITEQNG